MMAIDASTLLKRLEPAVRPGPAVGSPPHGRLPLELQPFGDLLALVSRGEVASGRPVELEHDQNEPFDDDQLGRPAAAADLAEAAGADHALMLIDGRGAVMDVARRAVVGELGIGDDPVVTVDAAVYVARDDEAAPAAPLAPPSTAAIPRPIADQIERLGANVRNTTPGLNDGRSEMDGETGPARRAEEA